MIPITLALGIRSKRDSHSISILWNRSSKDRKTKRRGNIVKIIGAMQSVNEDARRFNRLIHRSDIGSLGGFISRISVLTKEGLKEIQEIVRNRKSLKVLSWNPYKNILEYKSIVSWHAKSVNPQKLFSVNTTRREFPKNLRWRTSKIKCTMDQNFYTVRGIVASCELRKTDILHTIGIVLSSAQKSVLVGSALGDGFLSRSNKPSLQVTHGYKQIEYCQWKANILRPLVKDGAIKKDESRQGAYTNKPNYRFIARSHWDIYELRQRFYPDEEIERVPDDIESDLDELTMAIWFMDDGSTSVRKKTTKKYRIVELSTDRFSEQDCNKLRSAIENRWGIRSTIHWRPNKTIKKYPRISMFGDNADRFLGIVAPFIHPSMQYKLKLDVDGNRIDPTRAGSKICNIPSTNELVWGLEGTLISKVKPYRIRYYEDSLVFNIEVEHNHNFFAGGILTSDMSN